MDSTLKVLAVSSGGGHWVELLRVVPAFEGASMHYATVREDYAEDISAGGFHVVRDATGWDRVGAAILAMQLFLLVARLRPDYVVSTGAAPGYFALRWGKLFKARTIWVDSLANVDQLSRSGQLVRKYADLWLTQWPQLAVADGPEYAGTIL